MNALLHLASIFSAEKTEMLTVNMSPSVGTPMKHKHTGIYLGELGLKKEFTLQIPDGKCADIKYSTHIFILANSNCHKSKFKEAGKLNHFSPKPTFNLVFPGYFCLKNSLRFPAEESLLIFHALVDAKAIRIMG